MSCYRVIMTRDGKIMCPVSSAEEYRELRNDENHVFMVESVRSGNAGMKQSLMQMNYSCIPGEDMRLKGCKTASKSIGMDIDFDPEDPDYEKKMTEAPQMILAKRDEIGLLMLERSVNKGYHVVFKRKFFDGLDKGKYRKNQEINLEWASKLFGVQFDKYAKDITRVFFTTTGSDEDLLFLSPDLFSNEAATEAETITVRETDASRTGTDGSQADAAPAVPIPEEYKGLKYDDIIAKYWELFNNGNEPCEGDRNVKTYELASALRSICDNRKDVLEKHIPHYDDFPDDEFKATIASAVKEPPTAVPYKLRKAIAAVKKDMKFKLISGNGTDSAPERPKVIPAVMKHLSSKVPEIYKAMVEESVWPAICAHLRGVTFRYIDGVIHEANISSPLIGRQSVGKGNINQPIEYLMADITEKDKLNEAREEQWRQRNKFKGASKDKQPRPADLVYQRLDNDLTPAALSQSLIDAERNGGLRIMTKVDEIEMLNQVGNGKNDTVGLLVRYAFDSARWGQKRVGLESVNGSYTVRWCWNASCTRKAAQKFITRNWVANGALSRLNVNFIIVPDGNREIEKIKEYDDKYAMRLKAYIDRWNAATGLYECDEADKLARKMLKEHNRIADLSESEGYRVFSYRAVLIGWLKANILWIANGCKWDCSIAEYVAYSVRRDLWGKFHFFGETIDDEFEEEEDSRRTNPQNMISLLPHEFSYSEFLALRQRQGRKGDGKSTLRTWITRGYIVRDDVTGGYMQVRH